MNMNFNKKLVSQTTIFNLIFFSVSAVLTWLFYVALPISTNDTPNLSLPNIVDHFIYLYHHLPTLSPVEGVNLATTLWLCFILSVPFASLAAQALMSIIFSQNPAYKASQLLFIGNILFLTILTPWIMLRYFFQDDEDFSILIFIILTTCSVLPIYIL